MHLIVHKAGQLIAEPNPILCFALQDTINIPPPKTIDSPQLLPVRFSPMDELIKLVRTYRLTAGLSERLILAERIEPDLRLFVFASIARPAAEDALQEVLKAIAVSLGKFQGSSAKEFWGWCYRIARNKLNDQFRKEYSDRMQPVSPEELWQMVELSGHNAPISPADRHDLEYAMKLLTSSKPECYDFLWKHYVFGLDYADIAEEKQMNYDNVRMKIGRCLEEAKLLVS